jgi:hypothetical protein
MAVSEASNKNHSIATAIVAHRVETRDSPVPSPGPEAATIVLLVRVPRCTQMRCPECDPLFRTVANPDTQRLRGSDGLHPFIDCALPVAQTTRPKSVDKDMSTVRLLAWGERMVHPEAHRCSITYRPLQRISCRARSRSTGGIC